MMMAEDSALTREMLDGIVIMVNGRFFKGLVAFIKAARNK